MPIYEYECSKCGHTLEVIQKVSAAALTRCPACHKRTLHKRVSASAFHLKGSGWYVTDFKDKPKPAANEKKTKEDTTAVKETGKEDKKVTTREKTKPAKKTEPAATE
ncbi:MAG: FmdB family zinc ribbon protein [Gammaproteobacteria bacterium]